MSEEEQRGGHTIARHVGKSKQYLLSIVQGTAERAERLGYIALGLREGSFPSLEAANKLVNSTVDQNQDKIDVVTEGMSSRVELYAEFGSPTGYEAFASTERSETYGVLVVIVPDESSAKGYRVLTAYPMNR